MIRKCPICGGTDLYLYEHYGVPICENTKITVYCIKCGEIGTVDITIHTKRGTFELFEFEGEESKKEKGAQNHRNKERRTYSPLPIGKHISPR